MGVRVKLEGAQVRTVDRMWDEDCERNHDMVVGVHLLLTDNNLARWRLVKCLSTIGII